MRYEEYVTEVQRRMPGRSRQEAERTLAAVLTTLAERLDLQGARALAARLPDRLRELFPGKPPQAGVQMDEFLDRVSRRADVAGYKPRDLVLVVAKVLRLALPMGELPRFLESLPEEYRPLLVSNRAERPARPARPPMRG